MHPQLGLHTCACLHALLASSESESQGQSCREQTQLGFASVKSSPHSRSQGQSCRKETQVGVACVERSKAEGVKQRDGRCHKENATARNGPAPWACPPCPLCKLM
eukprot:356110-Chlamydomonas_euryale.AAC.1